MQRVVDFVNVGNFASRKVISVVRLGEKSLSVFLQRGCVDLEVIRILNGKSTQRAAQDIEVVARTVLVDLSLWSDPNNHRFWPCARRQKPLLQHAMRRSLALLSDRRFVRVSQGEEPQPYSLAIAGRCRRDPTGTETQEVLVVIADKEKQRDEYQQASCKVDLPVIYRDKEDENAYCHMGYRDGCDKGLLLNAG